MKLFVSPHNDDAVLFGACTLDRERPAVLTVFDSYIQVSRGQTACGTEARRREDVDAIEGVLGCSLYFGGIRDDEPLPTIRGWVHELLSDWARSVTEVWLPAVEPGGHEQHNLVGEIGLEVFQGARVHQYLTYTRTAGKSTKGKVIPVTGAMVRKKLQALACYKTQIEIDALGCWPHFICDQREYYAE